jgi:hypothetical protein
VSESKRGAPFFPKLQALHAVLGLDCPYDAAERAVAAVLILDRKDESERGNAKTPSELEEVGCAFRAQDGIARRAGLSRRAVQRALESLVARTDGPLVVVAKPRGKAGGAGGRSSNLYAIRLRASMAHKSPQVVRQPDAEGGEGCAPEPGGVVRQTEGGLCASQTQDLSTLDLSTDLSTSKKAAPRGDADVFGDAHNDPPEAARDRVRRYYVRAFERRRGEKLLTFDGEDERALGKLLAWCGGDASKAESVIDDAFASWRGHAVTIREIAANPGAFVGARRAVGRGRGRAEPLQHTPPGITGFENCEDWVDTLTPEQRKAAGLD